MGVGAFLAAIVFFVEEPFLEEDTPPRANVGGVSSLQAFKGVGFFADELAVGLVRDDFRFIAGFESRTRFSKGSDSSKEGSRSVSKRARLVLRKPISSSSSSIVSMGPDLKEIKSKKKGVRQTTTLRQ